MKNRTSFLAIRYFFYALLIITILQSCGDRTPIIDGQKPFVVGGIVQYNETHSKYTATNIESGAFRVNTETRPTIILPSRMYNIGDTIKCGLQPNQ